MERRKISHDGLVDMKVHIERVRNFYIRSEMHNTANPIHSFTKCYWRQSYKLKVEELVLSYMKRGETATKQK